MEPTLPTAPWPIAGQTTETVLFAIWPNGRAMTVKLPESGTLKLGRSRSCPVCIEEPGVSRTHAVLRMGSRFSIEDLGSSNGTRLHGTPLPPNKVHELRVGDVFEIAGVIMTIQWRATERAAGEAHPAVPASEAMSQALALAERVARGSISVLLSGETGVGKDVMAQHIHTLSPRAARPFLRLNCATLSESIVESELFGHVKGAFTGAVGGKAGLFETAEGGTVFLDEVGELSPGTQAKLLRVLEQREFFRVGSVQSTKLDVRFIGATNRDLTAEVARGAFRQDLYFRLAGAVIRIPALRERRSEILPFAKLFLAEAAQEQSLPTPRLAAMTEVVLESNDWPGNLRQLRNEMTRALLLCGGNTLEPGHLAARGSAPSTPSSSSAAPASEDDADRERILSAMAQFGGNQTLTARALGISRNTLMSRLDQHGIRRPRRSR